MRTPASRTKPSSHARTRTTAGRPSRRPSFVDSAAQRNAERPPVRQRSAMQEPWAESVALTKKIQCSAVLAPTKRLPPSIAKIVDRQCIPLHPANTFANTGVRGARLRIEKRRARAKVCARRQRACSRRRINCRRRNPKKTTLPQPTAASASLVAPAARASRMARPTDVRRCSLLRRRGPNTTTGAYFF